MRDGIDIYIDYCAPSCLHEPREESHYFSAAWSLERDERYLNTGWH